MHNAGSKTLVTGPLPRDSIPNQREKFVLFPIQPVGQNDRRRKTAQDRLLVLYRQRRDQNFIRQPIPRHRLELSLHEEGVRIQYNDELYRKEEGYCATWHDDNVHFLFQLGTNDSRARPLLDSDDGYSY